MFGSCLLNYFISIESTPVKLFNLISKVSFVCREHGKLKLAFRLILDLCLNVLKLVLLLISDQTTNLWKMLKIDDSKTYLVTN